MPQPLTIGTGRALLQSRGGDLLAYTNRVKAIAPASMLVYYPQADATGTTAIDESGLGRNGSYSGSPTLGQPGVGDGRTSVYYDGGARATLISGTAANAFSTALVTAGSFALAMKVDGAWNEGTKREQLRILIDGNNYVILQKDTVTGQMTLTHLAGGTFKTCVVTGLTDLEFIYVTGTIDHVNNRMLLYVNGAQAGSTATALGTYSGAAPTFSRLSGSAIQWRGWLAHFALWSSELTVADAAIHARRNGLVIFDGDSRTATSGYPALCMARAAVTPFLYGYKNDGVSGQTLVDMQTDAPTTVDPLYRGVFGTKNIIVLLGGLNDMIGGTIDGNAAYTRLLTYVNARKALGFRVAVCTELPASSAAAVSNNYLAARAVYNANIVAGAASFDAVVRLDLDSRIGVDGASDNLTYFNADKIHPNATGAGVLADLAAPQVAAL